MCSRANEVEKKDESRERGKEGESRERERGEIKERAGTESDEGAPSVRRRRRDLHNGIH